MNEVNFLCFFLCSSNKSQTWSKWINMEGLKTNESDFSNWSWSRMYLGESTNKNWQRQSLKQKYIDEEHKNEVDFLHVYIYKTSRLGTIFKCKYVQNTSRYFTKIKLFWSTNTINSHSQLHCTLKLVRFNSWYLGKDWLVLCLSLYWSYFVFNTTLDEIRLYQFRGQSNIYQ